jgi:hypothetical protein
MIHNTIFAHPLLRNFTFRALKYCSFLFFYTLLTLFSGTQSATSAHCERDLLEEWETQNRANQISIRNDIDTLKESLKELNAQRKKLKAPLDAQVRRSTTLERLHASYVPTLHTLPPETNYVDPQDPLFHVRSSPDSPLSAAEFVENKCFKFFRLQLQEDISALIRLVLKGSPRPALEISFDEVRASLFNLYIAGTLSSTAPQGPSISLFDLLPHGFVLEDDLKSSISTHLQTARQSLQTLLAESAELFEQYKDPDGSSPKKNALIRDSLSRRLGLTRATLHRVVEKRTDWKEWIQLTVLRPLIQAGTETWLWAILKEEQVAVSQSRQQPRMLATLHQLGELKKQKKELENLLQLKKDYLRDLIDQFPPTFFPQDVSPTPIQQYFSSASSFPSKEVPENWEDLGGTEEE